MFSIVVQAWPVDTLLGPQHEVCYDPSMGQNVQFDEDPIHVSKAFRPANKKAGPLVTFVIRRGLAKDERSANKVLLSILCLSLLVTIAAALLGGPRHPKDDTAPADNQDLLTR